MLDQGFTVTVRIKTIVLWLLFSPAVVLPLMWLWALPWDSPNAPAWVQAFGSIGAILVAVWVASSQERNQSRMRIEESKKEEVGKASRLCAAAREVSKCATGIRDMEKSPEWRIHPEVIAMLQHCLARLNANFDDDYNADRIEYISTLRMRLMTLIGVCNLERVNHQQQVDAINIAAQKFSEIKDECEMHLNNLKS